MKKNNKKGFTLAELLVVVAIIAVLVAISIPVFTAQLEKAREATDLANLRSAYAQAISEALTSTSGTATSKPVVFTQTSDTWVTADVVVGGIDLNSANVKGDKGDTWYVKVDATGAVTFTTTP